MDEFTALREHGSDVEPASEDVRTRARIALLRRADATQSRRAIGQRWRLPALAAAAGAVVVAVAFVISVNVTDGPFAPSHAAAEALRAAAAVAEARPVDPDFTLPRDGQYRYTKSESAFLSTMGAAEGIDEAYSAIVPRVREVWVAEDGSGRLHEAAGEPIFLGDRDRERWEAAGKPPFARDVRQDFGPGTNGNGLFVSDVATLPTDPEDLAAVLRARAESTSNDQSLEAGMFDLIGDLLRETVAPPALRAALYRVAADLPGVELVGEATDPAGRPGIAVAMTDEHSGVGRREMLVFDPNTSALLATETIFLDRIAELDADPPVRTGYAVFLESRIVDGLP